MKVVSASKDQSARDIVQSIVAAVEQWRDGAPPNDDMTVVALKITLPDRV
jgi:serine phosphatase RsbU (regulator of sigma subunit)